MDPLEPGLPPAVAAQRHQQLIALDNAIQATTPAPQTLEAAAPLLVPLLARLKEQKEALEFCMTAVSTAVEQSFAEDYYNDTGYALIPFFDLVTDLREKADRAADIHAQAQRLVALQAPAAPAAPAHAADDMDI